MESGGIEKMKRTQQMQQFLDKLSMTTYGITDTEAHEQHICVSCRGTVYDSQFKDELSRKEYRISALCQVCQDEVFGGK